MPAVLNNAIDWLSRPYGAGAIVGKPFAAVGATPTPYGGKWSHEHARHSADHRRRRSSSTASSSSQSARRGRPRSPTRGRWPGFRGAVADLVAHEDDAAA